MQTLIPVYLMISFQMVISITVGIIGVLAWIELRSFMKSTHRVEYVPLDPGVPLKKEPLRDEDLNEYDL